MAEVTSNYSASSGFASNGLNKEMVKRINMDGANAYHLKGNTDGVSANNSTFDSGQQDQFLRARTASAKERQQMAMQEQLRAAAGYRVAK